MIFEDYKNIAYETYTNDLNYTIFLWINENNSKKKKTIYITIFNGIFLIFQKMITDEKMITEEKMLQINYNNCKKIIDLPNKMVLYKSYWTNYKIILLYDEWCF